MGLESLVEGHTASIREIGAYLDGLEHGARVSELRGLGRAKQRTLYEKAAAAEALDVDFFVGAEDGLLNSVNHSGCNTLPLPQAHKTFEKRFYRGSAKDTQLGGYNYGRSSKWIGPGYFVAYSTEDRSDWQGRGGVVVDYFHVPQGPVPAGFPPVRSNSEGLQRFVYQGTRDFMRRVSLHVSIGAAYKSEKPLDHYFTLCRPR